MARATGILGSLEKMTKVEKERFLKSMQTDNPRINLWRVTKPISAPTGIDLTIVKSKESRQDKCYMLAATFVLDNSDWILVHGTIIPPVGPYANEPYVHGWAEKGNIVYEPVLNDFYKKDEYYSLYEPTKMKRYTVEDINVKLLKYKHWGFW